jgi:hypothetical protein
MAQVKYLGGIHVLDEGEIDVYQSSDPGRPDANNIPVGVNIPVGGFADVSDVKATQLEHDFPGLFEIDGKKAGAKPSGKKTSAHDADDE